MKRQRHTSVLALVLFVLILGVSFLTVWILFPDEAFVQKEVSPIDEEWTHAPSYIHPEDIQRHEREVKTRTKAPVDSKKQSEDDFANCQMDTCFNFNRCRDNFKVYVYPIDPAVPMSSTYEKILNVVTSSPYYTKDPGQACLFVLSTDTLDRDELSRDFVRNLPLRLQKTEVGI